MSWLMNMLTDFTYGGWLGLASLLLTMTGLGMMLADAARAGNRRPRLVRIGIGIAYAALHLVVLLTTLSIDPFALFEPAYLYPLAGLGTIAALGAWTLALKNRNLSDTSSEVGLALWMTNVVFLHLWMVAQAHASV